MFEIEVLPTEFEGVIGAHAGKEQKAEVDGEPRSLLLSVTLIEVLEDGGDFVGGEVGGNLASGRDAEFGIGGGVGGDVAAFAAPFEEGGDDLAVPFPGGAGVARAVAVFDAGPIEGSIFDVVGLEGGDGFEGDLIRAADFVGGAPGGEDTEAALIAADGGRFFASDLFGPVEVFADEVLETSAQLDVVIGEELIDVALGEFEAGFARGKDAANAAAPIAGEADINLPPAIGQAAGEGGIRLPHRLLGFAFVAEAFEGFPIER